MWIFYALFTAFSLSTADALSKRALKSNDEYTITLVREAYALPFLLPLLFFIDIPSLDATFWLTVLALLPLEVTALILYVKAIRVSPLSLTIPFTAASPIFIVAIAFIVLGELPDVSGMIGILLIIFGAYILNIKEAKEGFLAPLKAIKKERGSVYMLIVAFIYSITSTLGKVAITHSSPIFFGIFYPFILTLFLSTIVGSRPDSLRKVFAHPLSFLSIGIFTALMIIFHFLSLNLTSVAYMISVKRTSLIFSCLYGKLLFGESNTMIRFAGSIIMIAGVISIAIF